MAVMFSPARERARHAVLLDAVRAASLDHPAWVLCPRESLARCLLESLARAGGAFVHMVGWDGLLDALEPCLALPALPPATDAVRARAVERALAALPELAPALTVDPFGVALGLLSVADTLRGHGWDGTDPGSPTDSPADRLLADHLRTLGTVVTAVDRDLADHARGDRVSRTRRAIRALGDGRPFRVPFQRVWVEGVERLEPVSRDLLTALTARGVRVEVAPWVAGWTAAPAPGEGAPASPATVLEALATGVPVGADDGTVTLVAARDPMDEAESVARWVAERISAGEDPNAVAIAVDPSPGAVQRMARALGRYGVSAHGGGPSPTHIWPLWQAVRASISLAWRGVDVVDLATVLSAPGSGVWGADRDWLCAQLRRAVPTSWKGVRDVMLRATEDPLAAAETAPEDDEAAVVVGLDADPVRAARLAEIRVRLEELVSLWENHGPFGRFPMAQRPAALRTVVTETLARFVHPTRFREGVDDERVAGAWVAASLAIAAACEAALERVEASGMPLAAHDPGAFLGLAEPLLGSLADTVAPRRGDGVTLMVDEPFAPVRPRVLVVTGFRRGRFPTAVSRPLLLGPLERERLGAAGGPLTELPGEAVRGGDALRDTARMMSLPTELLVVCWPRRSADGSVGEPSLAWRDLLALLPDQARQARERAGFVPVSRWLADETRAPRSDRARLLDALGALGTGDVSTAVAGLTPLAAGSVAVRDLAAARFHPDRRFDVGDLVREKVVTAVFSPRGLETLLTCRYSFLTEQLLGLRALRLARSPSLTGADRTRVTRAALRTLDALAAAGTTPTPEDVTRALDDAVTTQVPWAQRGDMALPLEDLRRTVQRFLTRYMDIRRTWQLDAPVVADTDPATQTPVSVRLPGGRTVRVAAQSPRVETHTASGETTALVVDLRPGSTDRFNKLRNIGLDVEAALAPALAAAEAGGTVASFVRLSLAKPQGEALTGVEPTTPLSVDLNTTVVTIDHAHPLERHRLRVLKDVDEAMDDLLAAVHPAQHGARYAPHDEARKQELEAGGARTCESCAMRLGCRFKMAGGT